MSSATNAAADNTGTPDLFDAILATLFGGIAQAKPSATAKATDPAFAALFNQLFPPCDDPTCEACNKRREMAGEAPLTGDAAAKPEVDKRQPLVDALNEAGQALNKAIVAIRDAAPEGSAARAYAHSATKTLRALSRITDEAVNAL